MPRRTAPVCATTSPELPLTVASEALLHYAWAQRRYDAHALTTAAGEAVVVIDPGRHNTEQGPDFVGARVRIAGIELCGAVEIHLQSADWLRHRHHTDPAYNAVILHVVGRSDGRSYHRSDGTPMPELSLEGKLDTDLVFNYSHLVGAPTPVPCASRLSELRAFEIRSWIHRQAVTRVADKAARLLPESGSIDWAHRLLVELASGFGGPQNAEAFRHIAQRLPLRVLQRHAEDPLLTEALLFGLCGLLAGPALDDYHQRLIEGWHYLRTLHGFDDAPPIPLHFLRMRPAAFPSLRLAQLAAVLHHHAHAHTGLNLVALVDAGAAVLHHWLEAEPQPYWATHYRFGHPSPRKKKPVGAQLRDHLIINVIVPFAYCYHSARGDAQAAERAIDTLTALKPEHFSPIQPFVEAGVRPRDALESQGLLHLVKHFCTPRRCLECAIGHHLLKPTTAYAEIDHAAE